MPRRSLLVVAQLAPPSTLVAARRVAAMTKYLAREGHAITVLTSAASGSGPIEGAHRVIRTTDFLASPLNWRRRHFQALSGGAGEYRGPSRLQSVFVPDVEVVGWAPFALLRARRLSVEDFDCVITSSPPQSAHFVGLELRRRGLPWIAELRDGWTFDPPRPPWPTRLQAGLDRTLERALLGRADALVGVTKPIADDLHARLGRRTELITNGYDPELVPAVASGPLDDSRHSLVYTGRLAVAGRSVEPLLAAIRSDPALQERLEVVFAGPLTSEEQRLLGAPDLDGTARMLGSLDRESVNALQLAADSLLVVAEGISARSVATGKLFEYLGARRPILVLGEETEAARIVIESGAGLAVSASDPAAIAGALHLLVDDPPVPDPRLTKHYAYPLPASRLAALVEEVCSRRP